MRMPRVVVTVHWDRRFPDRRECVSWHTDRRTLNREGIVLRIVMEQSGHALGNLGDWAMVQVAVRRCRSLFPGCEIRVFGKDANRVRQCLPDVTPLAWAGQPYLLGDGPLLGRWGGRLFHVDRTFVRAWPRIAMPLVRLRHQLFGHDVRNLDALIDNLSSADLVMATGGGFINDEFPDMVDGVCGILRLAQRMGKPTAMFGQGLGPLKTPGLRPHRCHDSEKAVCALAARGFVEPEGGPKPWCVAGSDDRHR